jgi:hypothetical protein
VKRDRCAQDFSIEIAKPYLDFLLNETNTTLYWSQFHMKPPVSTCNFRQPPCPVSAAVKSWAEGRADFLDELVTTHGYSNIRWYCFANELENNVNFNNWVSSWTIDRPLDTRSDLWFDSIDGPTSHPFSFTYEYSASVQSGPGRRKVLFTKKPIEISRSQWQNNSARDPAGVLGGWLAGWQGTYADALGTAMQAKPSLADGRVDLVGLDDTYGPEVWLAARHIPQVSAISLHDYSDESFRDMLVPYTVRKPTAIFLVLRTYAEIICQDRLETNGRTPHQRAVVL